MKKHFYKQEKQHFSIRKYSFGAASVLIGATLIFGEHVLAEEHSAVTTNQAVAIASSDGASLPITDTEPSDYTVGSDVVATTDVSGSEVELAEPESSSATVISPVTNGDETTQSQSEMGSSDAGSETDDVKETSSDTSARTEENADAQVSESDLTSISQTEAEATKAETETRLADETTAVIANSLATTKVATQTQTLQAPGNYVYTKRTEVKNEAKLSAQTQFYANAGDTVFYDQVIIADGYEWISYRSYSGVRRYAPVIQIVSDIKTTGTINIENKTSDGFDVLISNVADKNGVAAVKVPIWSSKSGQDDIVWYDASRQSNGDYKVAVRVGNHKNDRGEYNIHLYYVGNNGAMKAITGTTTAVPEPSTSTGQTIPSQGVYTFTQEVEVKNEPKMSAKTEFTFAKGERINYDRVLNEDNYQWISYVSYSGTRRYIPIAALTVKETRTGDISIQNQANGDFNVVITNVFDSNGIAAVKVPVWSTQGGQDDIVWYDAANQGNNTYKVSVKVNDHKNNYGEYNVHLYYVQRDGSMRGVTVYRTMVEEPKVTPLAGTINIENKTSEGFDVIVTNASAPQGIHTVKIPVWSTQGGQDDMVWYNATSQADGSYMATVKVSNHKNNYGEYNVHLYYIQKDGSMKGVAGDRTTVEEPKPNQLTGTINIENKTSQGFDVVITNASASQGIHTVKIPVWSTQGGQDDIVWYNATSQDNSTYKVSVKVSDHKNSYGEYNVHLYYVQKDGSMKGVAIEQTTVEEPKTNQLTGTINIENKTSQGFDVIITNASAPQGIHTVKVPVWSTQGGQDDMVWYNARLQSNGTYKVSVKVSDHKNSYGEYNVHLYYVQRDGSMKGVAVDQITVEEPKTNQLTGTINIENKTSQGFDVVITNASAPQGIHTVKVPVWSTQGGQDDMVWYDATLQSNGTYKVSVKVRDHKNNYGEYNVHLYYIQRDGSMKGVAVDRTIVE